MSTLSVAVVLASILMTGARPASAQVAPTPAAAASPEDSRTDAGGVSRLPRVNLAVVGFPPEHPLSAMEVRADIANTTGESVTIRKTYLCLPSPINEARGVKNDECELFNCAMAGAKCQQETKLPVGQEHIVFHRMGSSDWKRNMWSSSLLFFQAGTYEYRTMVEFDIKDGTTRRVYGVGKMALKAPAMSLLVGAWCGTLLAALFYFVFQLRTQLAGSAGLQPGTKSQAGAVPQAVAVPQAGAGAQVSGIPWVPIRREAKKAVALGIAGVVTSLIVVVLIARVQDVPLPMNVAVNDFFGGAILGLGSYALGDWLFRKIFP